MYTSFVMSENISGRRAFCAELFKSAIAEIPVLEKKMGLTWEQASSSPLRDGLLTDALRIRREVSCCGGYLPGEHTVRHLAYDVNKRMFIVGLRIHATVDGREMFFEAGGIYNALRYRTIHDREGFTLRIPKKDSLLPALNISQGKQLDMILIGNNGSGSTDNFAALAKWNPNPVLAPTLIDPSDFKIAA